MHILPSYASSTIINGILGVPRCPGRPSFAACRAKVYRATCKKRFSLYFLIILFRLLPYITYYSIYSLTFHTRRSIILIPKEKEAGMITTNDILVDPLTELFHRKELCDNAMSCLPVGRLASSEKNGQLYYEGFVDGPRFTLKRDDPRITAFSDRHLVAATQKAISRKIHSLERGKIEPIVFDPNLLLPSISRVYQHPSTEIFRAMGFQDARNWATAPYEKNG